MPFRLTSLLSVLMPPERATGKTRQRPQRAPTTLELTTLSGHCAWPFPRLWTPARLGGTGVRMRRVGELDYPWRESILTIVPVLDPAAGDADDPVEARAFVRPGALSFGGMPVEEIHVRQHGDSLDRTYVLGGSYLRARACLRMLIEQRADAAPGERMEDDPAGWGGLYLETEDGALWLHAEDSDRARTRFVRTRID